MSVNPPLQIPENHSQEVLFYHIPHLPQPPNPSFASQRPLLAVIFRCENATDSQTGFEPGISQNISAVFSRISAIFGVGNPSWEDSLRRRSIDAY
jgi:TolB-like protein